MQILAMEEHALTATETETDANEDEDEDTAADRPQLSPRSADLLLQIPLPPLDVVIIPTNS